MNNRQTKKQATYAEYQYKQAYSTLRKVANGNVRTLRMIERANIKMRHDVEASYILQAGISLESSKRLNLYDQWWDRMEMRAYIKGDDRLGSKLQKLNVSRWIPF